MSDAIRYLVPDRFTRRVMNPLVEAATGAGLSVWGSRTLAVRGRSSGEWRTTPVNLLTQGQQQYLVSPRGVTQWVRNLRVAGDGELRLGRRTWTFTARELTDAEKPAVLRPYLERWAFEVGAFFEGVGADATDEQLLEAAPRHPVFEVELQRAPRRR